ncbi:gliding motility protein GldC [Hyphobacterium sp. CCMP332]|nr:gliding motility protein GldC [Hyphobacterium sp. CCMP332]
MNSEIKFKIKLDEDRIPEKIEWDASDRPEDSSSDTKAIAIGLWDDKLSNTLRIDLWTKDMSVLDMKKFYIDMIGGMAESIRNATDDQVMANRIQEVVQELVLHVKNTENQA